MALLSLVRAADRRLGLGLRARGAARGLRPARRRLRPRPPASSSAPARRPACRCTWSACAAGSPARDFQARARALRYGRARELAAEHGYDVDRHGAQPRRPGGDGALPAGQVRVAARAGGHAAAGRRPARGRCSASGAAEIREYCRAAGIEYGEDATNAAPLYARNVLRLEVLPRLEALNPRVAETLAAAAEQAAAEAEVLAAAAAEARAAHRGPPRARTTSPPSTSPRWRPSRRRCARWSCTTCCAGPWAARRWSSGASSRRCCGSRSAPTTPAASNLGRGLEAVRGARRAAHPRRRRRARVRAGRGGRRGRSRAPAKPAWPSASAARVWRVRLLPGAAFDRRGRAGRRGVRRPRRRCRGASRCATRAAASASRRSASAARRRSPATSPPPASRPSGARSRWCSTSTGAPPGWVGRAAPRGRVAQAFRVAREYVLMTLHVVQEGT